MFNSIWPELDRASALCESLCLTLMQIIRQSEKLLFSREKSNSISIKFSFLFTINFEFFLSPVTGPHFVHVIIRLLCFHFQLNREKSRNFISNIYAPHRNETMIFVVSAAWCNLEFTDKKGARGEVKKQQSFRRIFISFCWRNKQ